MERETGRLKMALNFEKADRLSALPLPLLHHILSFLPTKCAVQTCLLSRTWKHIWTSIPSLDFDDQSFLALPPTYSSDEDEGDHQQHEKTQFRNFVDQVLIHRDGSNLRKFRLCLYSKSRASYADKWLRYAVKHFVQEIEIRFLSMGKGVRYCPPTQLFACESLKDMNLKVEDGFLKLPSHTHLPNLEYLKLSGFTGPNNCIQQLLCCCPKLKSLNLTGCFLPGAEIFDVSCCSCLENLSLEELRGIKTINIFAPKLKRLIIRNSMVFYGYCSLKISAPNLLYFKYIDYMAKELCIKNLQNLADAVVNWNLYHFLMDDAIRLGLEFLKGLQHVRTLRLHTSSIKILSRETGIQIHLPNSFTNLKFLELVISKVRRDEFKAIVCLLKFCPFVETLVIEMKLSSGGSWESDYFPDECKLYNLKNVEIRQFTERNIELNLIKLLLKSAMVLERIIVTAPKIDLQKQKEISQKLLTYPRASLKMSIMFS